MFIEVLSTLGHMQSEYIGFARDPVLFTFQ